MGAGLAGGAWGGPTGKGRCTQTWSGAGARGEPRTGTGPCRARPAAHPRLGLTAAAATLQVRKCPGWGTRHRPALHPGASRVPALWHLTPNPLCPAPQAHPPLHLPASHRPAQRGDPGRPPPVAVLALHRVRAGQPGLRPVPASHLRPVPVRGLARLARQLPELRLRGRRAPGALGHGPRGHRLRAVPASAAAARPDAVRPGPGPGWSRTPARQAARELGGTPASTCASGGPGGPRPAPRTAQRLLPFKSRTRHVSREDLEKSDRELWQVQPGLLPRTACLPTAPAPPEHQPQAWSPRIRRTRSRPPQTRPPPGPCRNCPAQRCLTPGKPESNVN